MESDVFCFPAPLGCFTLPTSGGSSTLRDLTGGEEYSDAFMLRVASLEAWFRKQEPPGCFLCVLDTIGDEE